MLGGFGRGMCLYDRGLLQLMLHNQEVVDQRFVRQDLDLSNTSRQGSLEDLSRSVIEKFEKNATRIDYLPPNINPTIFPKVDWSEFLGDPDAPVYTTSNKRLVRINVGQFHGVVGKIRRWMGARVLIKPNSVPEGDYTMVR
jgi:hypothetical protein